jgi:hypothetical protein
MLTGAATGPCVTTTVSGDVAPTPAGGQSLGGPYELTTSTFYGTWPDASLGDDPDFRTRRETIVLSGRGGSGYFYFDEFTVDGSQRGSEEWTADIGTGVMLYRSPICPTPDAGSTGNTVVDYTMTPTTLILFVAKNGGTLVEVYTKPS